MKRPLWRRPAQVMLAIIVAVALAVALGLSACGGGEQSAGSIGLADGEYQVMVGLEGGTGRASVTSPTKMDVREGKATLTLEWSSPNYDYMVIEGERYLPVNQDGNSVFEIPVPSLDEPFDVVADTTAMSVPHEISYTLTVDPS